MFMPEIRVSLVIAETALELVPEELTRHASVRNHALRLEKKSNEILLDRSFHHSAMIAGKGKMAWKRGRPDIAHLALLEALSTPLFIEGILDVYIHTIDDKVIIIGPNLRVPKSYFRFEGVMMKLFKEKIIRSQENKNINCTFVIGGFPKGHYSEYTSKLFCCSYSIAQYAVESHIVIARVLYECEKILLYTNH